MDGSSDGVIGKMSWLPVADVRADPDGFLSEVLTGWKRQQAVSGYTMKTVARRNAAVLRMPAIRMQFPSREVEKATRIVTSLALLRH